MTYTECQEIDCVSVDIYALKDYVFIDPLYGSRGVVTFHFFEVTRWGRV